MHKAHIRARGELCDVLGVVVLSVHARAHPVHIAHTKLGNESDVGVQLMGTANKTKYISFRVTEEQLIEIETAATHVGSKARDWCRSVVLERVGHRPSLTMGERLLFEQFVRAQYLVTQGFQLLADDNLTADEWKRFRAIANEQTSELAEKALAMHARRNRQKA